MMGPIQAKTRTLTSTFNLEDIDFNHVTAYDFQYEMLKILAYEMSLLEIEDEDKQIKIDVEQYDG